MESNYDGDFEIIWENTLLQNVFFEMGTDVAPSCHQQNELRLDVFITYKKTTLREIANYLLSTISTNVNNNTLKQLICFSNLVVLYAISPKDAEIFFSANNEYRNLFNLFDTEFGEHFVTLGSLSKLPDVIPLVDRMVTKKLLEKDGERYYVVGHILKNVQIVKQGNRHTVPR